MGDRTEVKLTSEQGLRLMLMLVKIATYTHEEKIPGQPKYEGQGAGPQGTGDPGE